MSDEALLKVSPEKSLGLKLVEGGISVQFRTLDHNSIPQKGELFIPIAESQLPSAAAGITLLQQAHSISEFSR